MRYQVTYGENFIEINKIFDSEIEAHKFTENKGNVKITEICEHPADKIKILNGEVTYITKDPKYEEQNKIMDIPEIRYNIKCVCLICGEEITIS